MFVIRYESFYKDVVQGSLLLHTSEGRERRILSFIISKKEAPQMGLHHYGFRSNGADPFLFYVSSRHSRLFFRTYPVEQRYDNFRFPQFIAMRSDGGYVEPQKLYECVQRMFNESQDESKNRYLLVETAPDAVLEDAFYFFDPDEEEDDEEEDDEEEWV